jgi:glutaredoxin
LEAPAIVVRDDSQGLLFTWVDDKGDFHVQTQVADVPLMGRDSVRVQHEDASKDPPGSEDHFVIVDLRQARPDRTYPVRSMMRVDFEGLAVARREKTGPTLASAAPPAQPSGAPDKTAAPEKTAAPAAPAVTRPVVIIYGAEWCGACHEAARYLKRKGVAFVEKDVEKDDAAAREMQQKLTKNGLRGGSIPIIDVRGKVMVGFNAEAIDSALGQAM